MSSAEHVFDVVILTREEGDALPKVLHQERGLVARNEGCARTRAVLLAHKAGAISPERDLDEIEVLVTRPFEKRTQVNITGSVYVPVIPAPPPVRWVPPIGTWPQPYPDRYAPQTGFTSGYLSTSDTVKVTTGSNYEAAPKED